jgi:hypothetical protein
MLRCLLAASAAYLELDQGYGARPEDPITNDGAVALLASRSCVAWLSRAATASEQGGVRCQPDSVGKPVTRSQQHWR